MKLAGFIKEYNNIQGANSLDELIHSQYQTDINVEEIIKYLNQGYLLLAWMGYFYDVVTKEPIEPDSYYTDGIWVWPAYLPYYLKKCPQFNLPSEFLNYMQERNFKLTLPADFEENKYKYEEDFGEVLEGR